MLTMNSTGFHRAAADTPRAADDSPVAGPLPGTWVAGLPRQGNAGALLDVPGLASLP
jgi:hypothetical protein